MSQQVSTAPDAAVAPELASAPAPTRQRSGRRLWKRFRRNRLAVVALAWILFMAVCALWPSLVATHDPAKQDLSLGTTFAGPSWDHLLGTDGYGRDIFSRLVYGTRLMFQAILVALGIAALLGVPIGLLAGWLGGWFDRATTWVIELLFALPLLLVALAMIGVVGSGMTPAMATVGVLMAARFARLTRGVALAEREELYVDSARITGIPTRSILFRYLLPNVLPTLMVQVAIWSAAILLISATLSFLGFGAGAGSYDWGAMLDAARVEVLIHPWMMMPATLAIILMVLALNLVGDALQDAIGRDVSINRLSVSRHAQTVVPPSREPDASALLSLREISVEFPGEGGDSASQILDGVSLDVRRGETLAVVGESGSGKTMTVMTALGLTPPPGHLTRGAVTFDGRDVTALSERQWQSLRGDRIGVIFQEPSRALNPVYTVGFQLMEPLRLHVGLSKAQARTRAAELLAMVRVPDPGRRLDEYPHQFSGGMAQRVGIAIALACNPDLLIADEPTTALDVTVQGQILELLDEIKREQDMAMVVITHNLGVVADVADRVAVMYAGQVVESGSVHDVLLTPRHPYTRALLASMPQNNRGERDLAVIPGMVPSPSAWPSGCRFNPRCAFAVDRCRDEVPELDHAEAHIARCIRLDEIPPVIQPEQTASRS